MATTTNFGWETPDDTDLVKDGAAAIRTALGGVDTSFVDLKGGTTGQVLSKASNTDLDYTWVTTDDANAIQNAIVDAKGDLIAASAADTPARLAVGNNGETLVADSSTATGLKWGQPNSVSAFLYKSAPQTIPNATWTAVTFDSESWDTNGFHSTTTNTSRITIPAGLAGKYEFNARGFFVPSAVGIRYIAIYINGVNYRIAYFPASANDFAIALNTKFNLSAGDYLEVYVYQSSGGNLNFYASSSEGEFSTTFLGV